jgi:hypothetical protein
MNTCIDDGMTIGQLTHNRRSFGPLPVHGHCNDFFGGHGKFTLNGLALTMDYRSDMENF